MRALRAEDRRGLGVVRELLGRHGHVAVLRDLDAVDAARIGHGRLAAFRAHLRERERLAVRGVADEAGERDDDARRRRDRAVTRRLRGERKHGNDDRGGRDGAATDETGKDHSNLL